MTRFLLPTRKPQLLATSALCGLLVLVVPTLVSSAPDRESRLSALSDSLSYMSAGARNGRQTTVATLHSERQLAQAAAGDVSASTIPSIEKLQVELEALRAQLREQQRKIEELSVTWGFAPVGDDDALLQGRGAGVYIAQDVVPQAPKPVAPEPQPVTPEVEPETQPVAPTAQPAGEAAPDRPESEKPPEQLLLEAGGVLLPPGALQIEPSVEYSHASGDRVAINGFTIFDAIAIGTLRVDDIERDIITSSLNLRYGVSNRVQIEGRVPWVYREDRETLGVGTNNQREVEFDNFNLGDMEATVSYQPIFGDGAIPDTVLRLRGRFPTGEHAFEIDREVLQGGETRLTESPTGSGFYGVGPGATFVWRADPAVIFAGGGYTFNLERNFSGFGDIDPGDTIDWFAGLNLALSETVAINTSFVNQLTTETKSNGTKIDGTAINDARFVSGASIGLSPSTSLLVGASLGLTDESPDYSFTVSMPITLQLF